MRDLSIVVPIVTPCSPAGELDLAGLRAVCQAMVSAGCSSIFMAGSTGRGPWFSRNDRLKVCRTAAEQIGPDVPLLAGCMASGLSEMVENALVMADAGAQVAVVTAPGYFNYNHQEIEMIFLKFADASPLPVMIYDIPGFARVKLDGAMIPRLAQHGNIIGFKDSSGDFDRFKELIPAVKALPNFSLLQGKERVLVDSLLLGASGFIVSLVHIDPRPFAALSQAARAGQVELAHRIQAEIHKLMDVLEGSFAQRPETSTFFHFLNQALRYHGVCDNIVLDHEGDCPPWLDDKVRQAIEICQAANSLEQVLS